MKEKQVSQAHIADNWVICPFCFKKQFPLEDETNIKNLKLRCKGSRGKTEHFMIVNWEGGKK